MQSEHGEAVLGRWRVGGLQSAGPGRQAGRSGRDTPSLASAVGPFRRSIRLVSTFHAIHVSSIPLVAAPPTMREIVDAPALFRTVGAPISTVRVFRALRVLMFPRSHPAIPTLVRRGVTAAAGVSAAYSARASRKGIAENPTLEGRLGESSQTGEQPEPCASRQLQELSAIIRCLSPSPSLQQPACHPVQEHCHSPCALFADSIKEHANSVLGGAGRSFALDNAALIGRYEKRRSGDCPFPEQ